MKQIITVIKKELLDTLRDRKTLISAVLMPAIAFPILMFGITKLQISLMEKAKAEELTIILDQVPNDLKESLAEDENFSFQEFVSLDKARDAILADSIDALIQMDADFEEDILKRKTSKVKFFYKSTNETVYDRVGKKLDKFKDKYYVDRLDTLGISKSMLEPVLVQKLDIAPKKEQIGKVVGGFVPYIFVMFCFMACMYPALDMITGEKERGTMETLLTVPTSRLKILLGKMFSISFIGIIATVITLLGMFLSVKFFPDIPEEFQSILSSMVTPKFVFMLLCMIIPLAIFFAGILTAIVIRASSFKEAQSLATPVSMLLIIPVIVAVMPNVDLDWKTVWIPITNLCLATKEMIAGTLDPLMFLVVMASLIILAIIGIIISVQQFSKESMVLK